MGNKRNKNKKRTSWRKETGKNMINVMKRRRLHTLHSTEDNGDKENISVNSTQIPSKDVEINSDETNVHILQNIKLSQVPLEDMSCSLNIHSDERILDAYSHNPLQYNRCRGLFEKFTEYRRGQKTSRKIDYSAKRFEWLELRRKLLTASNFAKVVNRRQNTSVRNLVKNLIYPKNLSHVPSLKHGIEHEATATEQIASQLNIKMEPCGLFIDKKLPFLGATPDGIVGEDTIIEIKCPITAFKSSLDEAIDKKKVNFWRKTKNELIINKKHPWYIQVQGQLHITGRRKCIFGVWSGCDKDIKVEIIERDDQYWEEMEPKLEHFYITCMLPELCDPRHVRNMPIRDLSELK